MWVLYTLGMMAIVKRRKDSICLRIPDTWSLLVKFVKDVPGGFPKSDLLGVTVALIHVAAQ